jgi:hypothetical protein
MTEIDNPTTYEIMARFKDGLDPAAYETLDEPIGWKCKLCGGRFVLSGGSPASLERAVASLVDAAAYHHRTDQCDAP